MRRYRTGAARALLATLLLTLNLSGPTRADPQPEPARPPGESVEQALCRMIEGAANRSAIPVDVFTRLLWQESSFRPTVVSPAGAQGIAQFMPGTARERGLDDPFDPEQAIPASARFIAQLVRQFGNVGLAAAAYNGGPTRVANWLAGTGTLPLETQDYVERITGRSADDWKADLKAPQPAHPSSAKPRGCLTVVAELRIAVPGRSRIALAALAPWGVQLSGNFSKSIALASFERTRRSYATILGDVRPMIIGTRLRTRGFHAFYRVRVPAQTRTAADALCNRIRSAQGSCVVYRS